jgi:hypothetical protein
MSYAYDVMMRVWMDHLRPHVVASEDAKYHELADRFEELIESMHSANHKVPSADGVFKGDGLNKDPAVSRAARELDEYTRDNFPKNTGTK